MQQFVNSFRCRAHDYCSGIGASCSVDTLLELFYYCIYYHVDVDGSRNSLIQCLNEACQNRIRGGELCLIRLPVWHWCVDFLPEAFSPMGRRDAEILIAFQQMCKHLLFTPVSIRGKEACTFCTFQMPLPITWSSSGVTNGDLSNAVIIEITLAQCKPCAENFSVENFVFPQILVLELGIVNFRNMQNPPIVIPEHLSILTSTYTLTGAVLVRQDHFYCIAKVGLNFCVFDDLKNEVQAFRTFSGAVTSCRMTSERIHKTSPKDPGIHILLFVKDAYLRSSNKMDYAHFDNSFTPTTGAGIVPLGLGVNLTSGQRGTPTAMPNSQRFNPTSIPAQPVIEWVQTSGQGRTQSTVPTRVGYYSTPVRQGATHSSVPTGIGHYSTPARQGATPSPVPTGIGHYSTPARQGATPSPVPTGSGHYSTPARQGATPSPVPTGIGHYSTPARQGATPSPVPTGIGHYSTPARQGATPSPVPTGIGHYSTPARQGATPSPVPTGVGNYSTPTRQGATPSSVPTGSGHYSTPARQGATPSPVPTGIGHYSTPTRQGATPSPVPTGVGDYSTRTRQGATPSSVPTGIGHYSTSARQGATSSSVPTGIGHYSTPARQGATQSTVPTGSGHYSTPTRQGATPSTVPTGKGHYSSSARQGATPSSVPTGVGDYSTPTRQGATPSSVPTGIGHYSTSARQGATPSSVPTGIGHYSTPTRQGATPSTVPTGIGNFSTPTRQGATPSTVPTGIGNYSTQTRQGATPSTVPTGIGNYSTPAKQGATPITVPTGSDHFSTPARQGGTPPTISTESCHSSPQARLDEIPAVTAEETSLGLSSPVIFKYLSRYGGNWCRVKFHGKTIAVLETKERLFVPSNDMITLADLTTIKRKGYASLDAYLTARGMNIGDNFIFSEGQTSSKSKRLFISLDLLSDYLRAKDDDLSQILSHKLTRLKNIQMTSAGEYVEFNDVPVKITQGIFHCGEKDITFKMVGEVVFLSLRDFLSAFDIEKQQRTQGNCFLDKQLKKFGIEVDSAFLGNGRCRTYIKADTVIALINGKAFKHAEDTGNELMKLLLREVAVSASVKKQICTPKRSAFQKHVEVHSSPKQTPKKTQRSLFKSNKKKMKTQKGAALIKQTLLQLCTNQFGGDTDFFSRLYQRFL